MADPRVQQFDELARKAYDHATSPQDRQQATSYLQGLQKVEHLETFQHVLDRTTSIYSQTALANMMLTIVTENWNELSRATQLQGLRMWLFGLIQQRGKDFQKYVLTLIVNVLSRITNLGWLDHSVFQELPIEINKYFIQSPQPEHQYLGLIMLNSLVGEITLTCPKMTLSQHRKTVVSFRDTCLLDIFNVALKTLETIAKERASVDQRIVEQGVNLALACLTYDMVGIYLDESTDDVGTVHIPTSWKPILVDQNTIQIFWVLYQMLSPPESTNILKCVVQLASVRRSLFNEEEERKMWLGNLIKGVLGILRTKAGLDQQPNYHEFCRLLSRLKPNFQLSEIVSSENYGEWINLTAGFSIDSFVNWHQTSGSSYYLLYLWSRLVSALQYLRTDKPDLLTEYAPKVVQAYVQSRLEMAKCCVEQPATIENPLEDTDMLLVQLEPLPGLAKLLYDKIGPFLIEITRPEYNALNELVLNILNGAIPPNSDQVLLQLQILDSRLTWLVYIMGCIISHHHSSPPTGMNTQTEAMDGQITAVVLEISRLVQMRFQIPGQTSLATMQRLQSGVLYFLNGFRKNYIGENSVPCSKLYPKLRELTGLEDNLSVVKVIVENILTCIKVWGDCDRLITECINLLFELSQGLSSGKLAMRLDIIKMMITQHTHPQFSFKDNPANFKLRTKFYRMLTNFHFLETTKEAPFEGFMAPLKERAMQLNSLNDPSQFRSNDVRLAVIGWFRDVRGVCCSCLTKRTYNLFFDWIFPFLSTHQTPNPFVHKVVTVFFSDNAVAVPLLKLYAELVYSRPQKRIMFEPSSPNGILLFKEASAILKAYGVLKLQEIQSGAPPSPGMSWSMPATMETKDKYQVVYKPIVVCINILTRALSGSYCNFGVFPLYRDSALDDALEIIIKLVLTIPLDDLVGFSKLGTAYYHLLSILFNTYTQSLLQLPTPEFMKLVTSLEKGVSSVELPKTTKVEAAEAVGHLCTFYYNMSQKSTNAAMQCVSTLNTHFQSDPSVFARILASLFHTIIFDDSANQWAISSPLLPLILVFKDYYCEYKANLINSLSGQRQQMLAHEFERLLEEVESLEQKSRDRFMMQNITNFRSSVKKIL